MPIKFNMPTSIDHFCHRWQLNNVITLNLSSITGNYTAKAFSALYNSNVVLKISPHLDELVYEQKALIYFNDPGCVKLLDYDLERAGLLLEYIQPGIQLKNLFLRNPARATMHAIDVMKKLHKHPITPEKASEFKKIEAWLVLLENFRTANIPQSLLEKAKKLTKRLLASQNDLYLLHGDLHHENILQSETNWIAIDPKGIVGELAYEMGAFLRNPVPELLMQKNPQEIIKATICQLSSAFSIDQQKIIDWSFVQAVLAACWAEQDHDTVERQYYIEIAQLLPNAQ